MYQLYVAALASPDVLQKAVGPHELRVEVWDYNKIRRNVMLGIVDLNLEQLPVSSVQRVGEAVVLQFSHTGVEAELLLDSFVYM